MVVVVRGREVAVGMIVVDGTVIVVLTCVVTRSVEVAVSLEIAVALTVAVTVGVVVNVVGTPAMMLKSRSYAMGVPLPLFETSKTLYSPVVSWSFSVGLSHR